MPPSERNMNGHYNHNLSHQKQGRVHEREWESTTVNGGRAKPRMPAVPTLTQTVADAKRDRTDRSRSTRQPDSSSGCVNKQNVIETRTARTFTKTMETNERLQGRTFIPTSKAFSSQIRNKNTHQIHKGGGRVEGQRVKGPTYQSATGCYIGSGVTLHESGSVFGVYSETKYTFSVNGLPGNPAQASAAAAFFAR